MEMLHNKICYNIPIRNARCLVQHILVGGINLILSDV